MIKFVQGWKFQLCLSLFVLAVGILLSIAGLTLSLMDSVKFVNVLSLLALDFTGLSGVVSALVYKNARTGATLNNADREWFEERLSRDKSRDSRAEP